MSHGVSLHKLDYDFTRSSRGLALGIASLVALVFPVIFFSVSYQDLAAASQTEAEFNAALVAELIARNPGQWQSDNARLAELLEDKTTTEVPELRRILNLEGEVLAQSMEEQSPEPLEQSADENGEDLGICTLKGQAELMHAETTVGRFEVIRSLEPMLINTAWMAALGLFLGGIIYCALVRYPVRTLQRAVAILRDRAHTTLHSIGDAVITTDALGNIDLLNPVAEQLTGWSNAEAHGLPSIRIFNVVDDASGKPVENPITRVLRENRIVPLAHNAALIQRNGNRVPIEDSAAPIHDHPGNLVGVVLVFHDVSKNIELTNKLSNKASHDVLTGLINRNEFEQRLERSLISAKQEHVQHALCYMDLDQFKIVNDTCGHIAGDALLRQLAALLQTHIRATDCLARLGGDEFGLLLEKCPLQQAERIANQIVQTVGSFRFTYENQTFSVGVSIGLVTITEAFNSLSEVLSIADAACYSAKDKGRNRVYVYQTNDKDITARRGEMQWASRITQALDENRFCLYYQTIRPLTQGGAESGMHYEILVRMLDPNGEIVMPSSFIPAAERYNLMPAIDRWVIRATFTTLRTIRQKHPQRHVNTCSINLSGLSWNDDHLAEYIVGEAQSFAIDPHTICFEITETAAISQLTRAIAFITQLKSYGFRFSLDDFGSGVSSFGYLKQLPVDFLKIDGGFVKNMMRDKVDCAMVESINQIGHIMGLMTIAEFVESSEILEKLKTLGVDHGQGYGIAKPVPLDTLIDAWEPWASSPLLYMPPAAGTAALLPQVANTP